MLRLAPCPRLLPAPVAAAAQERRPSHCIAVADAAPGLVWRANYTEPVPDFSVRISYIDHAMFLLQTPGGLNAVTDYVGFLGTDALVPDVVTMNHAHSTHWTAAPDPAIPHVLRGWGDGRTPAEHHLDLGEMLVRNVPTDIRSGFGQRRGGTYGNSIFVFEVEGLCIGHLGHLHHEPDEMQYAALGRLDVVMAPVDGGLTLDLPTMIRVLKRLQSLGGDPDALVRARVARRLPGRHGRRVRCAAAPASRASWSACAACPTDRRSWCSNPPISTSRRDG